MTSAATATPTNEQIAELIGWRRGEQSGWYFEDGSDEPRHHDSEAPPIDITDPGTLGEAEAYCRERGWNLTMEFAPADATPFEAYIDPDPERMGENVVAAFGHSLSGTAWTAIYRAAEAVKA